MTIRSNIVYASNQVGISIGGYANRVGGTTGCFIVNNTLFGNGAARNSEGEFVATPTHPARLDYNIYDSPGGANNSTWEWLRKAYSSFAKYQVATHNDRHSQFADPQFVDSQTANFQLAQGSPARSAGVTLPLSTVGLFDFSGNPRRPAHERIDLGAYQD